MASKSNASRTVARAPAGKPETPASPVSPEGGDSSSPLMPLLTVGGSVLILIASIVFYVSRGNSKELAKAKAAEEAAATAKAAEMKSAALVEEAKTPETHAVAAIITQGGTALIRPEGLGSTVKVAPGGKWPEKAFKVTGVTINGDGKLADGRLEAVAGLPTIETVDVGGTKFSDAGLNDLSSAANLRILSAGNTAITDAGIARLATFKKLEHLDLAGDKRVTDVSAPVLAAIKTLKVLNVSETGLTIAGVASLVGGMPQCQVVHAFPSADMAAAMKKPDEVAKSATAAPTSAPAPTTAAATAPTPPLPTPKPGETLDLLKTLDLKRDVLAGECTLEDGKLGVSGEHTKIRLPSIPPDEYVLTLVANRAESAGALGVVLRFGRVQAMAYLGGDGNTTSGLDGVAGADYSRNTTGRNVPAFLDAAPSTIQIFVTKTRIAAVRDGVVLIDWTGDAKTLSPSKTKKDYGFDVRTIGLTTSSAAGYRFEKAELSVPSSPSEMQLPPLATPPTFVPGQSVDLLSTIDLPRDTIAGQWQFDGIGLVSPDEPNSRIQVPIAPPAHYALVIESEPLPNAEYEVVGVVVSGVQAGIAINAAGAVGMHTYDDKPAGANVSASKKTAPVFRDKLRHTLLCTVHDGKVHLQDGGKTLMDFTGLVRKLGTSNDLRVPDRAQLSLAAWPRQRITRFDLIPLDANVSAPGPLALVPHRPRDARPKPPSADAQSNAEKSVREQYKSQSNKKQPGERAIFGRQLYVDACKETDAVKKFVMLNEVREVALDAGDPLLLERAIEAQAVSYQVDALATQVELWPKLAPKVRMGTSPRDFAEASIALADELAALGRNDEAKAMADQAQSGARKAQDPALVKMIVERTKEVSAARLAADPATKAAATLVQDPQNAAAKLALGRYRAFVLHDLAGGLPMVAAGSDAELADLAKRSLAAGYSGAQAKEMGDAWWDYAEKKSSERLELLAPARYWYRRALHALPDAEREPVKQRLDEISKLRAADKNLPDALYLEMSPGLALRFRLIPAGEFTMGDANDKYTPPHPVRITRPFYISTTEVTQAQYYAVMGDEKERPHEGPMYPFYFNPAASNTDFLTAEKFCQRLNAFAAFAPYNVRLPTEAEWEYATRAGTAKEYFFDDIKLIQMFGWIGRQAPEPVGLLRPNQAGLFDVYGNVNELCSDWYDRSYYEKSAPDDPTGPAAPASGRSEHVARGGSFAVAADKTTSSIRSQGTAPKPTGLRLVLGL